VCVCVFVCVRAASRHLCQGLDLASNSNNNYNWRGELCSHTHI